MDTGAVGDSPIGHLVRIQGMDARNGPYNALAYVPDKLPDSVELETSTWNAVSQAMEALGRLRQACCQLPSPRLLIAPALAQEAVTTSALEGTYGALPELLGARLPQGQLFQTSPEIREIRAYERMAHEAFDWTKERPITVGLLSDLQGILAEMSQRTPQDPGRVREHQVFIGPEHGSIDDARFIPPPPGERLTSGLRDWQDWVNAEHELPIVVSCALAHYQFETLHPFGDGNGRVGRLVLVLQLLRSGALPEPALTISPWLLKRRNEYQSILLATSVSGDWNPLVSFFSRALQEQCDAHVETAQELLNWLAEVREMLASKRWGGVIRQIAEDLIDWPVISSRWVIDSYNVSGPTAHHAIDRLVEIGVLHEMTGRSYDRRFGATRVMELVESL